MKILVFGNIGSGKTTTIRMLIGKYRYEPLLIDDFRREYSDGSRVGEETARKKFYQAIIPGKYQIIECVGVGEVADMVFEKLYSSEEVIICLLLNVPKQICRQRLSTRDWDVPFPLPTANVYVMMEKTEDRINFGEIEQKWTKRNNTVVVSKKNIVTNNLKRNMEAVTKIMKQNNITA